MACLAGSLVVARFLGFVWLLPVPLESLAVYANVIGSDLPNTTKVNSPADGLAPHHSSWTTPFAIYAPLTRAHSPRTQGCAKLPNRDWRTSFTVRPSPHRILIDEDCAPNTTSMDAGVCVQFSNAQRKQISCLPSMVIFGFQKCGTGELQGWLSGHPVLHRWQGSAEVRSGAGEADFFNRLSSTAELNRTWLTKYAKAGFILPKNSDVTSVYTFEKSPKSEWPCLFHCSHSMPHNHIGLNSV